jgi:hypothetical protein
MFVIGWVVSSRIIIVFIAGDAPCAPIGLICTPLPSVSQLNDGTVNASCFAVMMLDISFAERISELLTA